MYSSQFLKCLVGYDNKKDEFKDRTDIPKNNEISLENKMFRFSKLATVPVNIKHFD